MLVEVSKAPKVTVTTFDPMFKALPSVHVEPMPITVQLEFNVNPLVVNV